MKERPKSAFLVLPWGLDAIGGVSEVCKNLLYALPDAGVFKPLLGICSWADKTPRRERSEAHDTIYLRLWFPSSVVQTLPYLWSLPRQLRILSNLLRANNVQVINFHYVSLSALNFVLLRALQMWRGGIVLSFHGADLLEARSASLIKRFFWNVLASRCDRLVTPSRSLAEELAALWPEQSQHIAYVHNGIDITRLNANPKLDCEPAHPTPPEKYILAIGTLEHKKGHDVLLRAFKTISSRRPELRLVIIGRPTSFAQTLHHYVHTSGLEDRVSIIEGLPHHELQDYYKKAAIFAIPSRYEPFGIVALEAGAYALPVVASAVGGLREIIERDVHGLLVSPDDAGELADGLEALLDAPESAEQLGDRLREHVIKNFSWKAAAERYSEIFKESIPHDS